VRLGVWLSNTRSRKAGLNGEQRAALAELGIDWAQVLDPAPVGGTPEPATGAEAGQSRSALARVMASTRCGTALRQCSAAVLGSACFLQCQQTCPHGGVEGLVHAELAAGRHLAQEDDGFLRVEGPVGGGLGVGTRQVHRGGLLRRGQRHAMLTRRDRVLRELLGVGHGTACGIRPPGVGLFRAATCGHRPAAGAGPVQQEGDGEADLDNRQDGHLGCPPDRAERRRPAGLRRPKE
jgi:hypothetical protein